MPVARPVGAPEKERRRRRKRFFFSLCALFGMGNETSVSLADSIKDALDVNFHSASEKMDPKESQKKRLQVF